MTIQYQQNNINQDGDSKNIVSDGIVGAIDLFGGGGGVAFVDANLGPAVVLSLPLAREAGRNAELTIIKVDGSVNTVYPAQVSVAEIESETIRLSRISDTNSIVSHG